jgi:hypothetical protein
LEQGFLEDVIHRLEKLAVTYAVTGSVASNLWGIPRTTHDVDIVVVLSVADCERVLAEFGDTYYVSEAAVKDAIARQSMFNIIDSSTSLKADLWLTKDDPFNQSMLARRRRIEIVPGLTAFVGSPEDVLLHKLVWHRITPSERQVSDAAGIAAVQEGKLDLAYLRDWAGRQQTAAILEEVLQGKYLKKT